MKTEYERLSDDGILHLLDSSRGICIPQVFANDYFPNEWDIDSEDVTVLQNGPDDEEYWDTWDIVLNNASLTDRDGNVWRLYQDGDLWAVCYELMSDETSRSFFGE